MMQKILSLLVTVTMTVAAIMPITTIVATAKTYNDEFFESFETCDASRYTGYSSRYRNRIINRDGSWQEDLEETWNYNGIDFHRVTTIYYDSRDHEVGRDISLEWRQEEKTTTTSWETSWHNEWSTEWHDEWNESNSNSSNNSSNRGSTARESAENHRNSSSTTSSSSSSTSTTLWYTDQALGTFRTYNDVASTAWYYDYVGEAAARHLMEGDADGSFRPNDYLKRSEVEAILSRMLKDVPSRGILGTTASMRDKETGVPHYYTVGDYSDLQPGCWYYDSTRRVIDAFGEASVNGYWGTRADGSSYEFFEYHCKENSSREYLVYLLGELYHARDLHAVADVVGDPRFTDLGDCSIRGVDWYINQFYRYGAINGFSPSSFAPQASLTRAQAAKILVLYTKNFAPIPATAR